MGTHSRTLGKWSTPELYSQHNLHHFTDSTCFMPQEEKKKNLANIKEI